MSDAGAKLKSQLEALLFVSDRPMPADRFRELIPDAGEQEIQQALEQLRAEYEQGGHGFSLEQVAGGYQLLTRPEHEDIISKLKKVESKRRLSRAALETLSIIAYKQPIKRADIESIRGVGSLDLIKGLMEMGVVRTSGRDEAPGAPLLYATTDKFLTMFGLKSLEELPKPSEFK
jgi:segregation and condensation protein B